jgi:DNA-binding transcriptional MocR family regulator
MAIVTEHSSWWERYKLAGAGASGIAAGVEAAVTAGVLNPGEALPPVRELAELLGVNANTVAAAYRALRDRGTVETRGRAGTRVRERPGTSVRQRPYALPAGTRDLSSGGPDADLLPRLSPPATIEVSGYRYAAAEPAFEEQLRARLARNIVRRADPADCAETEAAELIGRSQLLPVYGSLDGIDRLLATNTRPGDKVAVEDPAWGNLLDLVASRGLSPLPMRVDDEGPDPADLRAALTAGARVVIITVRAQNPYGGIVSARRARLLRAALSAHPEVLTIDDDHGADLTAQAPHLMCGATQAWAYLYSASKAYGPDMRIAALAGDAESLDRVSGQLKHTARNVSGVMQQLWATALADGGHDAVLERATRVYTANRDGLVDELAQYGIEAHGASGLNVWIPVPDETAAATGLLARGWAVAPGSWFRIHSGPGVRVTIAGLHAAEDRAAFAADMAAVLGVGGRGGRAGWHGRGHSVPEGERRQDVEVV